MKYLSYYESIKDAKIEHIILQSDYYIIVDRFISISDKWHMIDNGLVNMSHDYIDGHRNYGSKWSVQYSKSFLDENGRSEYHGRYRYFPFDGEIYTSLVLNIYKGDYFSDVCSRNNWDESELKVDILSYCNLLRNEKFLVHFWMPSPKEFRLHISTTQSNPFVKNVNNTKYNY